MEGKKWSSCPHKTCRLVRHANDLQVWLVVRNRINKGGLSAKEPESRAMAKMMRARQGPEPELFLFSTSIWAHKVYNYPVKIPGLPRLHLHRPHVVPVTKGVFFLYPASLWGLTSQNSASVLCLIDNVWVCRGLSLIRRGQNKLVWEHFLSINEPFFPISVINSVFKISIYRFK